METRITTHTFPSPPPTPKRKRAFEIAEQFQREHGRWPTPSDPGAAGEAARLLIEGNLRWQVRAPAQPFENEGGRWRRWTAALELGRLDRAERVRPDRRGRGETRPRGRTRRSTSAGRDPPDPDDEPPPLAARREGGRLGVPAYRNGAA